MKMETNRIQELLEKHMAFACNQAELEELAQLIASESDDMLKSELLKLFQQYEPTFHFSQNEKEQKLNAILNSGKPTIKLQRKTVNYFRTIAAVAASVIILFSIGFFSLKFYNQNDEQAMVIKAPTVSPAQKTNYTRHLTLTDGTKVILKTGSTLQYATEFNGKTREVILNGEAFFDVKHDTSKPFIIHTGAVKTTVLGTAFDIKAWPGQKNVIVSVTRGKVRVENDQKVLAVLTVNQSIDYNIENTATTHHAVNAEEIVTDWTNEDMNFDRTSFESIVKVLSKRYGKDITISNSKLANEKITSSFSGMESLENILYILCTINPDTQYSINDNDIVISSKN